MWTKMIEILAILLLATAAFSEPPAGDQVKSDGQTSQKPGSAVDGAHTVAETERKTLDDDQKDLAQHGGETESLDGQDGVLGKLKARKHLPDCKGVISEENKLVYRNSDFLEINEEKLIIVECRMAADIIDGNGDQLARLYDSSLLRCQTHCSFVKREGGTEYGLRRGSAPTEYTAKVTEDNKKSLEGVEKTLKQKLQEELRKMVEERMTALREKDTEVVIARAKGKIDMVAFEKEKQKIIPEVEKRRQARQQVLGQFRQGLFGKNKAPRTARVTVVTARGGQRPGRTQQNGGGRRTGEGDDKKPE